jgi:hypothetical protein
LIPNSVQVKGSDSDEYKELAAEWFSGHRCLCNEPLFRAKLASWQRDLMATGKSIIESIASNDLPNPAGARPDGKRSAQSTCESITPPIPTNSSEPQSKTTKETDSAESDIDPTLSGEENASRRLRRPESTTQTQGSSGRLQNTDSPLKTTASLLPAGVQSAQALRVRVTHGSSDSTLITATEPEDSAGCSARLVTLDSESSETVQRILSEQQCICGHRSGVRRLIAKPVMFGYGLNFQNCNHVVTFATHSFEQYYQAFRRCWRFGQDRPVIVDLVATEGEAGARENLRRKSLAADRMFTELVAHMNDAMRRAPGAAYADSVTLPNWLSGGV